MRAAWGFGADEDGRPLAIGIGFRNACAADTLTALVREAWSRLLVAEPTIAGRRALLATIARKDRPVLRETAEALGLEVRILSIQGLANTADRITVVSPKAQACFGIPSVAEAAALVAAGPGARLLLARISVPHATCAIAGPAERGTA